MDQYLGALRDRVFKDVAVLIYVFDVSSKDVEVTIFVSFSRWRATTAIKG